MRAVREGDVPTGELGRGVFCQIVEDKLDQSVDIVLACLDPWLGRLDGWRLWIPRWAMNRCRDLVSLASLT